MKGINYFPEWLPQDFAEEALGFIDSTEWDTTMKRWVQHYGFKYNYRERKVTSSDYLGPMPVWAVHLCEMIRDHGIMANPNQIIVNNYEVGQGIGAHIDCEPCFGPTICSISLLSPVVIQFINKLDDEYPIGKKINVLLEPNSLLLLEGRARYFWQHEIEARDHDVWHGVAQVRSRRVSLTVREVLDEFHQIDDPMITALKADEKVEASYA